MRQAALTASAANAYPPIAPAALEEMLAKSPMARADVASCDQARGEGWLDSISEMLAGKAQEQALQCCLPCRVCR